MRAQALGSPPRVEIVGLRKSFGATAALAGVALRLDAGSIHGLVGENGAGKSTLIKCLAGVHRPDAGEIRVDGAPVRLAGPREAEALGIGIVHQELDLVPSFDAVENIFLGRRYPARFGLVDRRRMRDAVLEVLRDVAPDLPLERPVKRLAVGERQLVEIARALFGRARVIVLDEPTASLGAVEAERLHGVVRRMAAAGAAVLYVSHRLGDVLDLCDRVTVLRNGATVHAGPARDLDHDALVALMSGRPARDRVAASPAPSAGPAGAATSPALDIDGLALRPGRPPVRLGVRPGEVVALYGLLGSGRSRLLKTIWGAHRADAARIAVLGARLRPGSIRAAIEAGVGYVPEERRTAGLLLRWPVAPNLSLPQLGRVRLRPWLPWPSRRRERDAAAAVGRMLDIRGGGPRRPVAALSGGNQQKVLLGRWLLRAPTVLLLDEPTRGVDVGAKRDIHATLRDLAGRGTAALFATSDIEEACASADRVLVLRDGALAGEVSGPDLTPGAILALMFGVPAAPRAA